jgi:Beta-ketoacyl synthase, N-terminal domain
MTPIFIDGVGLFATGFANWASARAVLRGEQAYEPIAHAVPPPEWLPPAERRRTSDIIRLAMCAGREALEHAQQAQSGTYTVFSSSGGSGEVIHQICESLATTEREVSPTRFHNSVHNAPAGYWGIASRSEYPSTSLCGHDDSFAAGLLEAVAQVHATTEPVLLLVHDLSYPEPLNGVRTVQGLFSVALLLRSAATAQTRFAMQVELNTASNESSMSDEALERFRINNPAARSLPLLSALANESAVDVLIASANQGRLKLNVRAV